MVDPDIVLVDFGVGAYEYWGATGYHSDEHLVTRCCEAEPTQFWPEPPEPDGDLIPEDLVVDCATELFEEESWLTI